MIISWCPLWKRTQNRTESHPYIYKKNLLQVDGIGVMSVLSRPLSHMWITPTKMNCPKITYSTVKAETEWADDKNERNPSHPMTTGYSHGTCRNSSDSTTWTTSGTSGIENKNWLVSLEQINGRNLKSHWIVVAFISNSLNDLCFKMTIWLKLYIFWILNTTLNTIEHWIQCSYKKV